MRVDLNPSSMAGLTGTGSATGPSNVGPSAVNSQADAVAGTDDVAVLSTGNEAVRAMRVQLDQVPDVRQDRVDSLRQAISAGTFTISPTKIAEGMMASSIAPAAVASSSAK